MYKLNEQEIKILSLIAEGNIQMAELLDVTGLGGEILNHCIEALDQNRYIEREGFVGGKFWTFSITEKGLAALPEMNEVEQAFYKLGLWPTDLEVLEIFKDRGGEIASQYVYANLEGLEKQRETLASMVKLLRLGYMREFGFVRRKVELTETGRALLAKYRT
ncbi:MAG: hypothetical protein FWC72_06495 [Oscillospiraceae bacterium]|nr:hypothetical protein [Oscillospiraceae bacterium]